MEKDKPITVTLPLEDWEEINRIILASSTDMMNAARLNKVPDYIAPTLLAMRDKMTDLYRKIDGAVSPQRSKE